MQFRNFFVMLVFSSIQGVSSFTPVVYPFFVVIL